MKKSKIVSYRFSALWSGVYGAYRASLFYGVVYNLSHGMVALVYIIGAIAMFLPRTATLPYRSISPRRVRPMRMLAYALIPP